jgi:hypothetical protein
MSPSASLKNQDVNLTITFDLNTLGKNITIGSSVYCRDNASNSWPGTILSRTKLNCIIKYDQHNSTLQQFQVVLKTPSYSSQDIVLSLNYKPLYYLTAGNISFSSPNQVKFDYTSTYLPVNVTMNVFLPNELKSNIICKLSDSNTEHLTYIAQSIGDIHLIVCNFTTTSPGSKNITIWYRDSFHKFQLSTNGLELVFATKSPILLFSPLAIKANRTKDISVYTRFDTSLNYGSDFQYLCEYGFNETSGTFSPTKSASFGIFTCSVKLDSIGNSFMKIWLKAKNVSRIITSNVEFFKVFGNISIVV